MQEKIQSDQEVDQQISLLESSRSFEMLKNPYDRMEYLHLTDRLIHRLEGTEEEPGPDVVVYLDKSARPVSWMVRELWDDLARVPGTNFDDGIVPPRPKTAFLNIDSKHMFTKEDIPGLRSLFTVDVVEDIGDVENMPTHFDGKKVLIVDEIGVSGATLSKAQAYFELAFPNAEVSGFTWMDQGPETNYGGGLTRSHFNKDTFTYDHREPAAPRKLKNNLRWYADRSLHNDLPIEERRRYDDGRGIIDRDAAYPDELESLDRPRTKWGKQWLSAAPKQRYPRTKQVIREIPLLAQELRDGLLPYWPDENRDDFEDRFELVNKMPIEGWREFRNWFKNTWWQNWAEAPVVAMSEKPDKLEYQRIKKAGSSTLKFAQKYGLFRD